jgi:stearoyl-CoA desaturase (Delta-9 desaturase)
LSYAKKLLTCDPTFLKDLKACSRLHDILESFEALRTAYQLRAKLQAIWSKSAATHKELVESLQEWCRAAEASGISALLEFSYYLRSQTTPETL